MALLPASCFVVPGDWNTATGGYRYDRRIVRELTSAGWPIERCTLHGSFPWPDTQALAAARRQFEALPDGMLTVVDGLAFGALPCIVQQHSSRLRLVALVHHPLHLETGLDAVASAALRQQEQRALTAARRVIVTSAVTVRDVERLGVPAARITVVEPGTDTLRVAAGANRVAAAPLQLLCVAALVPRKGHALLLEALAGLSTFAWTLHCVGSALRDPATAQRLRARAALPDLAGRVVWHGEVDDDALAAHYAAADVFVLPSLHEGYGMAVAEALAAGLPTIASTGVALAALAPAAGICCVPSNDVAALRDTLARLIAQPAERERLHHAALAAARALPTWQAAAARFADAIAGAA